MGRLNAESTVTEVMRDLDANSDGDIDIGEFEDWYRRQPDRKIMSFFSHAPVRIESVVEFSAAARQGLMKGMRVLAINGTNTQAMSLREVEEMLTHVQRPLRIEFDPRGRIDDSPRTPITAGDMKVLRVTTTEAEARAATAVQTRVRGRQARRETSAKRLVIRQPEQHNDWPELRRLNMDVVSWLTSHDADDLAGIAQDMQVNTLRDLIAIIHEPSDWMIFMVGSPSSARSITWRCQSLWDELQKEEQVRFSPLFSVIFNRKVQKLPLFSSIS